MSNLVVLGVAVSAVVVFRSTNAALSGVGSNANNNWNAGTVSLSDDDASAALFNFANDGFLAPGSTGTRCIAVTYSGNVESEVRIYADNLDSTNSLDSYLDIKIEQGSGGSNSSCVGFVADVGGTVFDDTLFEFASSNTSWASSTVGDWSPSVSGNSKVFKITYTMNVSAPNGTQGGTAEVDFVWEAQST